MLGIGKKRQDAGAGQPAAQTKSIHIKPIVVRPTKPVPQTKIAPQSPSGSPLQPSRKGKGGWTFKAYLEGVASKHVGLESSLKAAHVKGSLYDFIKRMLLVSLVLSILIGAVIFALLYKDGQNIAVSVLLGAVITVAAFQMVFNSFLNYPKGKSKVSTKLIERDIIFAARDMMISLRSGMPLFNAITYVSTGYGDSSLEFKKIIERVQVGTPLVDAIDEVIAQTKSPSFRRLLLQASVSIRSGADVLGSLQSVVDQLSQERIITMRTYGQKLNLISMMYMLFGIILPSMGIAVFIILTTFIPLFTITTTILLFALVGIFFIQVIFLKVIKDSRPAFSA